ncbi:MAG: hypothetical protein M3459_00105 [Actinomycetota bacterium]|nr:hypothetical protein [Actinomycetota bacterium]
MNAVRNLDLVVLALALAVFLATGLPILGYLTAAGVWAMWRLVGHVAERLAEKTDDPRRTVGLLAGSMIGRGWVMGLSLLAAGLAAGDDVGLSAAVLCVVLFTLRFTVKSVARPVGSRPAHPTKSPTT